MGKIPMNEPIKEDRIAWGRQGLYSAHVNLLLVSDGSFTVGCATASREVN